VPSVAALQNVGVGAELALVGFEEGEAVGGARRRLEVEDFKLAVSAHEQVYFASQDIPILLQGYVHFSLDDAPHLVLILTEVVHHLLKRCLPGRVADRSDVAQAKELKTAVEECANTRLVQRVELAVQRDPMDFLNSLVHKQPEEDHCRPGRGEIVLTEELVLPWARLVDLQVACKAVGALDGHPLSQLETLRRQ
jgi:hypothetical protein